MLFLCGCPWQLTHFGTQPQEAIRGTAIWSWLYFLDTTQYFQQKQMSYKYKYFITLTCWWTFLHFVCDTFPWALTILLYTAVMFVHLFCSSCGGRCNSWTDQHRWCSEVSGRQLLHVSWCQPVWATWRSGAGLQPTRGHPRPEGV